MSGLLIWLTSLIVAADELRELHQLLSPDEQQRAERFVFPEHRANFIVARARLRQILAKYQSVAAADLCFEYNAYGKPSLLSVDNQAPLHFNVSHSHQLAIYAFHEHSPVGVDIEWMKPNVEFVALASRFFSVREAAIIQSLSEPLQLAAFYRCWTRKEALLKALGEGLSFPLNQCEVTCGADEPARIVKLAGHEAIHPDWTLMAIPEVPTGYMAAVVTQSKVQSIELQWW